MNVAEQIGQTDKIFEYGIGAGMFVVSVLLTLGILSIVLLALSKMAKNANNTFTSATENFIRSVERMDDHHREERKLWEDREDDRQKQSLAVQEASNRVVGQLEQTIRECILEKADSKDPNVSPGQASQSV